MARGTLRIFLGAAPGVGKTYEMLEEAHRLRGRGEDVVVAFAMDHGRADTRALLEGLEVIPPRRLPYRGTEFEEMDLDAVLARGPGHRASWTNTPTPTSPAAGTPSAGRTLTSCSTPASTSSPPSTSSTWPPWATSSAPSPTSARPRRCPTTSSGGRTRSTSWTSPRNCCASAWATARSTPPDKIDAALSNYFRLGNLTALRELALLWLADRVDEGLARYRARERHRGQLAGPGTDRHRADRRPRRRGPDPPRRQDPHPRQRRGPAGRARARGRRRRRRIAAGTGGPAPPGPGPGRQLPHRRPGEDPAARPAGLRPQRQRHPDRRRHLPPRRTRRVARRAARRGRRRPGWSATRATSTCTWSPIRCADAAPARARRGDLGRARVAVGFVLAALLPVLLQLVLAVNPDQNVATAVLVQLTGSVAVALVGGLWPAILAALWSSLLVNYFSTPPVGNLTISDPQNVLALLVFVGVSAAVAVVVDLSARRSKEAARRPRGGRHPRRPHARRGRLGGHPAGLLEQALDVFQVRGAALYGLGRRTRRAGRRRAPRRALAADCRRRRDPGPVPHRGRRPADAGNAGGENIERIDASTRLVLFGRILPASDRRLLGAFGVHLAAQLERQQLLASRRESPSAGRKQHHAHLHPPGRVPRPAHPAGRDQARRRGPPPDRGRIRPRRGAGAAATIEECSDRLDLLVGNLLDMSRITSESVVPCSGPCAGTKSSPPPCTESPPDRVRVELPRQHARSRRRPRDARTGHREHRRKRGQVRARFRHRHRRSRRRAQLRNGLRAAPPASCASSTTARACPPNASSRCSVPSSASTTSPKPPA